MTSWWQAVAFGWLIFQMLPVSFPQKDNPCVAGSPGRWGVMRKLGQEQGGLFALLMLERQPAFNPCAGVSLGCSLCIAEGARGLCPLGKREQDDHCHVWGALFGVLGTYGCVTVFGLSALLPCGQGH